MADRSVVVRVRAVMSDYNAAMRSGSATTKRFTDDVLTGASKNKRSLQDVGTAGIGVGAALEAGFGLAVNASMKFEQRMDAVGAVTSATSVDMDRLADSALAAGRDTVFSATEAAQATEELAKAGISTADILGGALTGALDLAAAGELDLANAATIASQAMNIFEMDGGDVAHIADVLAASASKTNASVDGLGDSLRQGGLVAAQTGLTFEETVTALSMFAEEALIGSDAGTSLKTMLQRLNPQSAEAGGLMRELGFSAYDAEGKFVGLDVLANELQTSLSGLTDEQRNAALATLFGSDAVRGANVLYKYGAAGVHEYAQRLDDYGAAARMAEARTDNLAGDIEELGGSFETALIKSGSTANGILREIVQTGTAAVNVYSGLPAPLQATATGLVAVVGGATLLGGGLLLLLPRIHATRMAMQQMNITAGSAARVAFNPMTLAITVATIGLGAYAQGAAEAKAEVEDMTAAIEADSGALDENSRASLVNRLEKHGVLKEAAKLGLSMEDVASAALGEADALQRVNDVLDEFRNGKVYEEHTELGLAARKVGFQLGEETRNVEKGLEAYGRKKAALGDATGATDAYGGAISDVNAKLDEEIDRAETLKNALDALVGVHVSAREAAIGFEDAVDGIAESMSKNGKSLDITTAKGRANQKALLDIVNAGQKVVEAREAEGASAHELNAIHNNTISVLRQQLYAYGLTTSQVDAFQRALGLVPDQVTTALSVPGLDTTMSALDALNAKLDKIPRNVQIKIATTGAGGRDYMLIGPNGRPTRGYATGGRVSGSGSGDTVPAMLTPGEFVVREPVARASMGFLTALNAGQVRGFAAGGPVGMTAVPTAGGRVELSASSLDALAQRMRRIDQHFHVEGGADPQELGREAGWRVRAALAGGR